jgi:hypothetical protein
MPTTEERYSELRKLIEGLPPPTPRQLEEQRFDFAYGNLATSTNHKPSRAAFWWLAQERGWTVEQFRVWAEGREWLP